MKPDAPIPCAACGVTCVVADEYVGNVYCAACGHEFAVSREDWALVTDKDIAWMKHEERREAKLAEARKTRDRLEAWERWCRSKL